MRLPVYSLLIALFLVYYPFGMLFIHKVDDNADFVPASFEVQGGSHAVAMAAGVVDREISRHWAPNDPFFYPSYLLTRMPAFQRGLISGVARFTLALSDHLSRARGSSAADDDVQRALGLLSYPPNVWLYDWSVSWLPTASTEKQYESGVKALQAYNERLGKGVATYDRRADNLIDTLERFAADLGASSGATEGFMRERSALAVIDAGALYYETKGKMYIYYLLLHALGQDFADIIREKQLEAVWKQAEQSLKEGMELDNWVVINAAPDNQILPSHLAAQGFFLLRARTQLFEITNILLK